MPLSVPTNPNDIPGVVTIAASQAQSVKSVAATAASSVAGQAQSAVSSAITAVESAVSSTIPKNCSLGVRYFCVGFTDHIDYKKLPINLVNIISSSVPAIGQLSTLASLDRALAVVNSRSITSCLALGLCSAVFSIVPDIICICFLLAHQSESHSFDRVQWIAPHARRLCSVICCMSLTVLTIILYGILSKSKSMDLPKEITVKAGEASTQVLAAFTSAIFMGIFTIIAWVWDRWW
ncbi:uncharacterized protein PAC_01977 [Phialocephala subalpina]|uniref:Uncharacterized protein n=1 Tax=Phialocephala subalpina TaxID=576137 RepID=A0A1L7WH44_9HELO|nr:uncharacterized protein PAC_01977 [Phialocephala subalpina]